MVREVLGGANGTAGVIPATTAAEATYDHQYTFDVPVQWNDQNLRVIAMATEKRNGASWTVNVVDADFTLVGIEEQSAHALPILIQPNPAQRQAWLRLPQDAATARVQVFATDGRVVHAWKGAPQDGLVLLTDLERLPAGAYLVRVEANGRIGHERLVVQP